MYRYGSACVVEKGSRLRRRGQEGPSAESHRMEFDGRKGYSTARDGIRHDLVARVRQEIAAGTYDTPEKLELALERMFDQLGDF
jgi:hypothetical protein